MPHRAWDRFIVGSHVRHNLPVVMTTLIFVALALITVVAIVRQLKSREAHERESAQVLEENTRAGLNEPPTLHPVIDEHLCIGCGA